METPASAPRLTAEERKAILDQHLTAAVARGGRLVWWGRSSVERVVSSHRYLQGRIWGYALPLLIVLLFAVRVGDLLGWLGVAIALGAIVVWVGRTRYERVTVNEQGVVKVAGAGLLAIGAGATLLAGLDAAVAGGAHLEGVVQVAIERAYPYDFRLASLLLLGMLLVFGGVLCLTAVRGVARGRRSAWERGAIGAILLILVAQPMTPLGAQGQQGTAIVLFAGMCLFALALALWQLEPADTSTG
jgi:hypothetical protein